MGQINKFANLYREQKSGALVCIAKAPLQSISKEGAPISKKYPGGHFPGYQVKNKK